ncbi:hypothetical protein GALMADRAFT_1346548 [Galerina marginata CBS 339.88]|uniref:Mannan endo-1,6-alpha-mannosidase n=1 Tax=Galerina marginata (strain CBS 339.88) TaxID=685588 RepID=A0A067SJ79_GALM3|nr:hypothetical protein GALMADRAFT_1346548 [Galerina marginata CBS 339.88]
MISLRLVQVSLLALCGLGLAQDLSVDPNWRKPYNSRPKWERVEIAQHAINAMLLQRDPAAGEFYGIGYWQSANAWSAMALQDQITQSTTNKDEVVKYLNLVFAKYNGYDAYGTTTTLSGGLRLACTLTKPTENPSCCSTPLQSGTPLRHSDVITEEQALSGKSPVKDFTLLSTCDGATMAGGVFWRPNRDDQSLNSITNGLSAYLAELTGDLKYKDAAIIGAAWIKNHNIDSENIVLNSESAADCTRSPASWIYSYNAGKFIEGLSVLTDVTKDDAWYQLMLSVIAASVKNSAWQESNGIINQGSDSTSHTDIVGFKAIFVRGLFEASRRSPGNEKLINLIHSYVDVQYNAILDLARNGTSYGADWRGPRPTEFSSLGQLAALDVLSAAIETNANQDA